MLGFVPFFLSFRVFLALQTRRHIVELIMNCKYDFKGRRWKRVSKQAKAFVEDLLVVDPEDRATADMSYRSTWLNRRQMTTVRNAHAEENEKAQESLLKYAGYSKLKKVVRYYYRVEQPFAWHAALACRRRGPMHPLTNA